MTLTHAMPAAIRQLAGLLVTGTAFFVVICITLSHLQDINESNCHAPIKGSSIHSSVRVASMTFRNESNIRERHAAPGSGDEAGPAASASRLEMVDVMGLVLAWITGIMFVNLAVSFPGSIFSFLQGNFMSGRESQASPVRETISPAGRAIIAPPARTITGTRYHDASPARPPRQSAGQDEQGRHT